MESVTTEINGSNRTLKVGREVSLWTGRYGCRPGRHRLTRIEREVSGRLLFTVFGPLSSKKPRQAYMRAEDIKAIHIKPKKARPVAPKPVVPACDNCLAEDCPGASGNECRERG